jgi:Abortive infection alpha
MGENDSQSLDMLGLKSYGDTAKIAVEKSLDGAGAFLSKICLPVAEEFGLFLKDRVHIWRSSNVIKALKKAEKKYEEINGFEEKEAHPRMLASIIENVSWSDDDEIQDLWAGLLVSSCTNDGKDDSNLIFVNLLSQLTNSQVKILNYGCLNSKKSVSKAGWIGAENLEINIENLQNICQIEDFHRLDRELDHLRAIQLLNAFDGGFNPETTDANITPSSLALHLFVRCQGSSENPVKYFEREMSEYISETENNAEVVTD